MEWFKECRESHTRCIEHNNVHSFVPTRLLDVGAGSEMIYLREVSAKSNSDYAALSYCWGGPQPIMTTVANLEKHMTRGIPVDGLPATIQDAITVARRLGLQYLWIDALCIIQDMDADKGREVGHMGQVYRTATITICASTAKAVTEGFLNSPRQAPEVMQKRLHLSDEIQGTIGWAIVYQVNTGEDHPLDGRAWTMQEYFLSPRRLVYSQYELIWDCYTIGPRTITTSHLKYAIPDSDVARGMCGAAADTVAALTPWSKSRDWRFMLAQYTSRSMTFPSDRLNAVLGVADEVCTLWGDSHLFGLLCSDMILQLGWYVDEPTCDVQSDRGPSWAWVSTTDSGCVQFIGENTEEKTMKPGARFAGVADDDRRKLFLEARLAEVDEAKFPMIMEEPPNDEEKQNLYPDLKNYKRLESDQLLLLGRAQFRYDSNLSDVALVVREVETGTYRRQGFVYFPHDLAGYDRSVWDKYEQQKVTLI